MTIRVENFDDFARKYGVGLPGYIVKRAITRAAEHGREEADLILEEMLADLLIALEASWDEH